MEPSGAKLSGGFVIEPDGDYGEMKLISTHELSKDVNLGEKMENWAF